MYCLRLRWSLGRLARRATWVDIWADEDAAAFIRGVNGGNETVPTVAIGGTVLVNPSVRQVVALATAAGIPTGEIDGHWWRRVRG